MVPLAKAHGVGRVARTLRVNYTGLKNRVLTDSATTPLEVVGPPGFIELSMTPGLVGPPAVIVEPVDFRIGIDGLVAVCRQKLTTDPMAGALFVFANRRRRGPGWATST